ncbi:capsule assembly Wzi family protein [Ferrimonas futtsuensis]|uniref:capsule assembly Wzi family protein n=1 Tax=Ferrimonas futtsuensis TaxID=364764 RepID=UPI0003F5D89E|nr:capsule assembly Wzi family protein [Ferrimonas futtsuensis]
MTKPLRLLPLLLALGSSQAMSAPWVSPNDLHLRADIQRLADEGVIKVPVNTFPLMWASILTDLENTSLRDLSPSARAAFTRVQHRAYMDTKTGASVEVGIGGATEEARFQHFGSPLREQGEANVTVAYQGSRFAGQLSATYAHDPIDGDKARFDGSYIAMVLGNWVFSADMQEKWWGPGWDSALLMSNNARPMPTLSLSRNRADAFETKWLSWIGPWTLTTGISLMDDERYVEDALLWTFRASAKPLPQLEIGVSRAAQICGEGRPCDLGTWGDMLTGNDNPKNGEPEPGNQVAGIDLRWGSTFRGTPYGIYWETMGEDSFGLDKFPPFQAKSYVYGADISYQIGEQQVRTFLEYSDTSAWCNGFFNCTYEHSIYKSGYRYNNRSIGSTYDNDAYTYTLGHVGFMSNGHQWKANIRYLDLNHDNSNRASPGGNTVAERAEVMKQIDFSYIMPLFKGRLEVGAEIHHSSYEDDIDSKTDGSVWADWRYRF